MRSCHFLILMPTVVAVAVVEELIGDEDKDEAVH